MLLRLGAENSSDADGFQHCNAVTIQNYLAIRNPPALRASVSAYWHHGARVPSGCREALRTSQVGVEAPQNLTMGN